MRVARDRTVLIGLAIVIAIALTFLFPAINTQAQSTVMITPNDIFALPESHGSIQFAVNGSCASATLQNGTWVFTDLELNNYLSHGTLRFSTENSNVTVYYFHSTNQFSRTISVKYTADNAGKQYVNLGLNTTRKTDPSEWFINVPNGGIVVQGVNWKLLPDNTVEINGLKGNVTVTHYYNYYPPATGPFYVQHSIAILTAAVAAVTVAVAVGIKFRGKH
jgi:hypothetical protein